MPFTLLLGGARSGKSEMAIRLAREAASPVEVVATATAGDAEMAERIERHRSERPGAWRTHEEPLEPAQALLRAEPGAFVVVDCLTLWVSNLLGAGRGDHDVLHAAEDLAARLHARHGDGAVVSNEVGWGIVPREELSRRFRDLLGSVNALFAARADEALLVVAGKVLPLRDADA